MDSFLEKVLSDVDLKNADLKSVFFILPNKRSCSYFKKIVLEKINKATFSPTIISIDSFIIKISGLTEIKLSEQLFLLFNIYDGLKNENQIESFSDFRLWAQTFLNDISEIDQNLLDAKSILTEVVEINKINNWSKDNLLNKETFLQQDLLIKLYSKFKEELMEKGEGFKGMCYKEAKANLEHYKTANNNLQHIFIGLNSLSKSEEIIVKELVELNKGEIYWDIDKEFLKNKAHGAAFFIRDYKKKWKRFNKKPFKWEGEDYIKKKKIQVIGAPKTIGQAKVAGSIISSLKSQKPNNTIVVLPDEYLLKPVLNFIENPIDVNVTIKPNYLIKELKNIISIIFELQSNNLDSMKTNFEKLRSSRLINPNLSQFEKLGHKEKQTVIKILSKWENLNDAFQKLKNFFNIIFLKIKTNSLEHDQIKHAISAIEKAEIMFEASPSIKELNCMKEIVLLHLDENTLNYEQNLRASIQIMGLLESRAINFENVIISSVNEGIIPKGKTYNSLLPYDLRKKHMLHTHLDQDAIYTYHFYRLIKRAKNVFLIHNNFNQGVIGGEKSRFIYQMEIEETHKIIYKVFNPTINSESTEKELIKTPGVLKKLKELASTGFSPSSLENYLKNPQEFYYKNLLNVFDKEEKGAISPRIIGLIFHDSLERLYKPFVNKKIKIDKILLSLSKVNEIVKECFLKNDIKDFKKGKKAIVFEIIKNSISSLMNNDINDLKEGNTIKIIDLEKKMDCSLEFKQIDFSVKLKGVVDRIDERNGKVRIIDYKTGLINPSEVLVKSFCSCFVLTHLKSMQLLCYSLMYLKNNSSCNELEAGLISMRELKKGLIKFGLKVSSKEIEYIIDQKKIDIFEQKLKELILEIMDPTISFKTPK